MGEYVGEVKGIWIKNKYANYNNDPPQINEEDLEKWEELLTIIKRITRKIPILLHQ